MKTGCLRYRADLASGRQVESYAKHIFTPTNTWEASTYYVRDAQGNVMATYLHTTEEGEYDGQPVTLATYTVSERHIYGSSRLGMETSSVELIATSVLSPYWADASVFTTNADDRVYEMSNHLGNVLATFTGRKLPLTEADVVVGFAPHVTSLSDYYPFGSGMEGRTVTEGYRYGFNAMEREDELYAPGSAYDFGARMYDGRLGRWWSVDPLAGNYADVATYSAFGNSPIYFLDPDGRKLKGYSETDAAKLGIVIQTVLSEYQVVAAFFTVNYETHEFNPVDMEALYSELGKIDNADARAVAYTLAKAINSDVTYEVAFVEDNQDILLISRANYGTGKELDAVNGGGVIQVDPRSFRVLLNEESIGRSEDLMMYLGDANVLNDGSIRRSPSVEAASIGGIILSMYNSSEPFMTSKVPLQEDGKLSKLQQGVKMVQTQNVVERLIKGVELRGLMHFGGTVNKEVLSDNTTPDEQLPVFGSNPRTLAPYQERDLNP